MGGWDRVIRLPWHPLFHSPSFMLPPPLPPSPASLGIFQRCTELSSEVSRRPEASEAAAAVTGPLCPCRVCIWHIWEEEGCRGWPVRLLYHFPTPVLAENSPTGDATIWWHHPAQQSPPEDLIHAVQLKRQGNQLKRSG